MPNTLLLCLLLIHALASAIPNPPLITPSIKSPAIETHGNSFNSINDKLTAALRPNPYSDSQQHSLQVTEDILLSLNLQIAAVQTPKVLPFFASKPKSIFKILSGHGREISDKTEPADPSARTVLVPTPSFFQLAFRAAHLSLIFSPSMFLIPGSLISTTFRNNYLFPLISRNLASAGPAWIKWGQWASTRADMFPAELCSSLADLHANAPAHSWTFTKETVVAALALATDCGDNQCFDEVFAAFDEAPVASGSIAQVHRALINPTPDQAASGRRNPTKVAVKVRHPNVAELIDRDFRIMRAFAGVVDKVSGGWLSVRSSIEQFSHTMAEQARLDVEGHHLDLLNWHFRSWPTVNFPRTIFSSQAIVIETFEEGELISDLMALSSLSRTRKSNTTITPKLAQFIVTTGESLYLKMLLVDNLMHADLHPGNILLDASRPNNPMLSLVDAGMVAELDSTEAQNFIGLLSALGSGDARRAATAVLSFGGETTTNEEFALDMEALFAEKCRGYHTNVDVGSVLRGVLNLVRVHQIRINANYATLVVNVLCIESLAKTLLPHYNILDGGKPLLNAYRTFLVDNPTSRIGRALFKIVLPFAHVRKQFNDRRFFDNYDRKMSGQGKKKWRVKALVRAVTVLGGCVAASFFKGQLGVYAGEGMRAASKAAARWAKLGHKIIKT